MARKRYSRSRLRYGRMDPDPFGCDETDDPFRGYAPFRGYGYADDKHLDLVQAHMRKAAERLAVFDASVQHGECQEALSALLGAKHNEAGVRLNYHAVTGPKPPALGTDVGRLANALQRAESAFGVCIKRARKL